MKEPLDFLCLLAKLQKSLTNENIKIVKSAGSSAGLTALLQFEGKDYGLIITTEKAFNEAFSEFEKASQITCDLTQN